MKGRYIRLNRLNLWANLFVWALYFVSTAPLAAGYIPGFILPLESLFINTAILAIIFYANYYLIIPFILKRFNNYAIFIGLLISIFLIVVLRMILDNYYYIGFYFNGKEFMQFPGRLLTTGLFLLLSTVLSVLEHNEKHKQTELQLLNEKLLAELSFLKQQINPHFLFNALNNIYTLSYLKDENAPQVIMKLSEIMRYMLYECKEDKVLLEREMHILENYIELQKLKSENQEQIEFTKINIRPGLKIAPLILINFIENAFKHSNWGNKKEAWIKLLITVTEKNELYFNVKNTISKFISDNKEIGGIGLTNAKKQLEFAYPGKHSLLINDVENIYDVDLKIIL